MIAVPPNHARFRADPQKTVAIFNDRFNGAGRTGSGKSVKNAVSKSTPPFGCLDCYGKSEYSDKQNHKPAYDCCVMRSTRCRRLTTGISQCGWRALFLDHFKIFDASHAFLATKFLQANKQHCEVKEPLPKHKKVDDAYAS
jgi:hypothetical protein